MFEHVLANHLESSIRRICAVVPGWLDGFEAGASGFGQRLYPLKMAGECEMSRSLRAGWKFVVESWRPDAVMVSLADKPLVTPAIIDSVIAGCRNSGRQACVPVYRGRRGHPVILPPEAGDRLAEIEGDRGARSILDSYGGGLAEIPVESDAILIDIDTMEDFEALKKRPGTGWDRASEPG
jgi:molybdenum cofactor cytidylyltransferase